MNIGMEGLMVLALQNERLRFPSNLCSKCERPAIHKFYRAKFHNGDLQITDEALCDEHFEEGVNA